jgi:DNA mismatch repair ATPase MutS
MGSRLLRDWLVRPSIDIEEIDERQRAVAELVDDPSCCSGLRERSRACRTSSGWPAGSGWASRLPRELVALRTALDLLPASVSSARRDLAAAAPLAGEPRPDARRREPCSTPGWQPSRPP